MIKNNSIFVEDVFKNGGRFSLIEEPRKFAAAFHQHWTLVLSIGFFFGWLLSFPLQGPLFLALTEGVNVSLPLLSTSFLLGLILGFAAGGITGYFSRRTLAWFALGAIPCCIVSWMISGITEEWWWLYFSIMGFFSGAAIICWGHQFVTSVRPDQRGHTFALAAVLANLVLYLIIALAGYQIGTGFLIRVCGILSLGMTVFILYRQGKKEVPHSPVNPAGEPGSLPAVIYNHRLVFPFVFAIYAVGGLMYAVVGRLSSPPSGWLSHYGLLPYIVLLFLAGFLADRVGRRINAMAGAIAVGIGFMALGLFTGSVQYVLAQTLLVGGYAFLDVFTWVFAADAAGGRKGPLFFSAVQTTNILAILTGILLGGNLGKLTEGSEILTVSLAGIFCFISLTFVIRIRDYNRTETAAAVNLTRSSLQSIVHRLGLTPRESEVTELLISGASTQEIQEKLVIAPDTLKSHLRNIYRKAGVRNRLEFTLAVMNGFKRTETGGGETR